MSKTETNTNFLITLQKNKNSEISLNEFYSTHRESISSFLNCFLKEHEIKVAWEPCAGRGNITRVLEEYGIKTYSTDLVDRNCENIQGNIDFLEQTKLWSPEIDTIITNPPFSLAEDMVQTSMIMEGKNFKYVIMFLRLTFLEGKNRFHLFKKYPPYQIYVHSARQGCSKTGEIDFQNGGACAYAWFVWKKGHTGDSIIKWIPFIEETTTLF